MLKKLESYFIARYENSQAKEFRTAKVLYYFLLISTVFAIAYFFSTFATGFLVSRYLMAATTVWFLLQIVGLRTGVPLRMHAQLYLFSCWLIVAILSVASGGFSSDVLPWCVILPVIALTLSGKKSIVFWTLISVVTVAAFYVLEPDQFLPDSLKVHPTGFLTLILHTGLILILLCLVLIFYAQQTALLKQVEDQRSYLQATEEELRQSVEELSATQDALAEKEAEASSMVSAIRENFHVTEFDLEGTITYANDHVIEMSGRNPVGLNRFKHMDESQRASRLETWKRLKEGQSISQESKYEVEGHTFWVMSTYAPILNRMNEVSRIMSIAHNITQHKQQEKALHDVNLKLTEALEEIKAINESLEQRVKVRTIDLEEKNKRLTEYAFINSHLLRAPLCRLLGLIQLMELSGMKDIEPDLLKYVRESGHELDTVVRKINEAIESRSYFDRESIGSRMTNLIAGK